MKNRGVPRFGAGLRGVSGADLDAVRARLSLNVVRQELVQGYNLRRSQAAQLQKELIELAAWYLSLVQHDEAAINSRAASKNRKKGLLEHLSEGSNKLVQMLDQADTDTIDRLAYGYISTPQPASESNSPITMFRTFEKHMRRFRDAAAWAAGQSNNEEHRGRKSLGEARRFLARNLASLYEKLTGDSFTYDVPGAMGRPTGDFRAPGARWVAAAMRLIDPSLTESNFETILSKIRKD